jgi:hypothetical protein
MIDKYAAQMGLQPNEVRFYLDGVLIKEDDTPDGLDVSDNRLLGLFELFCVVIVDDFV